MSFDSAGSVTLTTDLPSTRKHIVRSSNTDAIIYWPNATSLSTVYRSTASWSTAVSGRDVVSIANGVTT